ncbi:MAG: radical SAM protein [Candidatus Cryptobacteroides sp.]
MLHFDDIVFGPVFSRRLGNSLGMNILPVKGKTCNFDCVYCECGWNRDGMVSGRRFPTAEEVRSALETSFAKLASEGVKVDSITMSGNGEPTLNPDFPQIVDSTLHFRDIYFPQAKVSVLSNATMLGKEGVLDALKRIDNPILKVDAGSDELVSRINNPVGNFSLETVLKHMEEFEGDFILQTMFLQSPEFNTATSEALEDWYRIVRSTRPREIMVYTIDRETPDKRLGKCTVEQMTEYVKPLLDEGFNIQIRG